MRAHIAVVLAVLSGGCGALQVPPPPLTVAQLARTPTIFIRVYGRGLMPAIAGPLTYDLCVDLGQARVVDVHDPATGKSVDDRIANVLRGWSWDVQSSVRLTGGVKCWRERFEPFTDVDGGRTVRAVAGGPVRMLDLAADRVRAATGDVVEDDLDVAFVDLFEEGGVRYVMLLPRLSAQRPNEPVAPPLHFAAPTRIAGDPPHLPDLVRIRFRGNTLTSVYRVCLDAGGARQSLVAEVPIDGAAEAVARALEKWVFTQPRVPTCSMLRFVYTISP